MNAVPSAAHAVSAGAAAPAIHPDLALLRSSSLAKVVQQEIERLIVSGEIRPGAKLTEAMLAARLGVSRGPVREAIRVLEQAGLVRQEKNRGAFVRDVPLDEAMEIYQLRAMLEAQVGRMLAGALSSAQIQELRAMLNAMELAAKGVRTDEYHLLNLRFHERLVEFTGNRKLASVYGRLIKELSLFRRRNLSDASILPQSAAQHRRIVKAIAAGDAEAAARAMQEHVLDSRERTERAILKTRGNVE